MKQDKIRRICEGKEIRIFSARDDASSTVTFVQSFRNCGRKHCVSCRDRDKKPHGPYWNLNYTDEHGRARSLYIGRKLPDHLAQHKVLFADVQRYFNLQHAHQESIQKLNADKDRLRKEIERLYEDLRQAQKHVRRSNAVSSDKTFKELVNKYHPDRHRGKMFAAEDVMKDINRLYHSRRADK